jgi:hypothetical protein
VRYPLRVVVSESPKWIESRGEYWVGSRNREEKRKRQGSKGFSVGVRRVVVQWKLKGV